MPGSHDASGIKRFFKDAATYAVSGAATTFIGVVMVPIYTRVFTPGEYGALDLIVTLMAFLNLFLLMGQQGAVGRFYADSDDDRDKRLSASTSLLFVAALSLLLCGALLVFHERIAWLLLGGGEFTTAVAVALIAVPSVTVFRFLQNMLRWRQEPGKYLGVSVASMVVGLSATIYLVVIAGTGIKGVFGAMLINSLVFCAVALALGRTSFAVAFSFKRLGELLRFGAPLVWVAVAYYLLTYSNRYFLRYFEGLEVVGLYAIAVRVSSVLALVLNGFQMAIGPFVYSHYRDDNAPETFAKTFDYVSVMTTVCVTGLALFAADIISIFATETYLPAQSVVPVLVAGTAVYGLGTYFSFGIGIAKKTLHRAWTGALGAGMNVVLNLILVPRFGMMGAAVSTAASFCVLAFLQIYISQRLYSVPYRFKRNLIVYCAAAAVIVITYATGLDRAGFVFLLPKIALTASVLAVAIAVKLVSRSEYEFLKKLIKNPGEAVK
jgi:O-antigen/teichoic acid export membrane protein